MTKTHKSNSYIIKICRSKNYLKKHKYRQKKKAQITNKK
jgi:hypothetical protein